MASLEMCGFCQGPFQDPRILLCAHSFCLKCLESIASNETLTCPSCKTCSKIAGGGLKHLKKNEFINCLTSISQKIINCDSCSENQALKFCTDCALNFCRICLTLHGKLPATTNHRIESIKYLRAKDETNDAKQQLCEQHSEMVTLLCEDCHVNLCSRCFILDHKNHNIKHLYDYFDSVKNHLEENLMLVEGRLKQLEINFVKVEETKHDWEMRTNNLKKQIIERGENIMKVVRSHVDELIGCIDNKFKLFKNDEEKATSKIIAIKNELTVEKNNLKKQLKDLNFHNASEVIVSDRVNIFNNSDVLCDAKFFGAFSISLCCDDNIPNQDLEKMVGTLRQECRMNLVQVDDLKGRVKSFTSGKDGVFLCYWKKEIIKMFDWEGFNYLRDFNCAMFSEVYDLLVVGDELFVLGLHEELINDGDDDDAASLEHDDDDDFEACFERGHDDDDDDGTSEDDPNDRYNEFLQVVRFDVKTRISCQIFSQPLDGDIFRISKSKNNEIIVALSNKILHLSRSGDILKRMDLSFDIGNALQLDGQHYVCCIIDDIHKIDGQGKSIAVHHFDTMSRMKIGADVRANVYVAHNFESIHEIIVLDSDLKHMLTVNVNEYIIKICFDDVKDRLMVMTKKKIMTFEF